MDERLGEILHARFGGELPAVQDDAVPLAALLPMARHVSQRAYLADRPVDPAVLRLLCAVALSAPSKSDLQQRDIIVLKDPKQRWSVTSLLADTWIREAPAFLVFCGNNRRQRHLHEWRGKPFANDHLDAFFNATVDAAIVLSAFIVAAETIGLGCCAISEIRDHAQTVSDILGLPQHVFPVAGLALGWPRPGKPITPRLPLEVTVHHDRFDETGLRERINDYDHRRAETLPYRTQRDVEHYGSSDRYGWSEDKARQFSKPLRAGFGLFVRGKGFDLR